MTGNSGADVEFDSMTISAGSVARLLARNGLGASVPYRVIYQAYINSAQWRTRRDAYFAGHPKSCTVCGESEDIHLHHATYERFTAEADEDLVALCGTHHAWVHHLHRTSRHTLRSATDAVVASSGIVVPRDAVVDRLPAGRLGTASDAALRALRDGQAARSGGKESKVDREARVARQQAVWASHPLAVKARKVT